MIVKGCCRKVIFVKDTGSKYIDSAYFILKDDLPTGYSDRDMLREAERIINSDVNKNSTTEPNVPPMVSEKPKKAGCDGLIAFFSGAATVGAVAGAISLIANLLY